MDRTYICPVENNLIHFFTYVENAIRIVKFKIGDKVDLKPVCGHFTEDLD